MDKTEDQRRWREVRLADARRWAAMRKRQNSPPLNPI